jgi:SHAQKYF class myb-like DNA-binding protein
MTVMNEIENTLGPGTVTTGSILERMEIPGLTYAQVSSHLQKYRQKKLVEEPSRVVDPEVQADVDALAEEIMEAAEQRKNDQSEQTMYTRDPENFVPENGTGCVPGGFVNHRSNKSVELCGDCKTQVENLKRSNDPLVTFEFFRPCPTCLSAAISVCPPCEADIHGDGRNRANDGHGKVNYPMLKNKTPRLQIQRHRAADGKLVCKQCWTNFYRGWTPSTSAPKRKYGTGNAVCRSSFDRERWEAVIGQNKRRKSLGTYDTKVEALNACDSYLEDPDGFVVPPPLKRRKGTGSVVCTKTGGRERWRVAFTQNYERKEIGTYDTKEEAENACGRYLEEGFVVPPPSRRRKKGSVRQNKSGKFMARYKGKHIGTFDTGTQAYSAIDAILAQGGTGKTNPATSSTSGLEDLAMVAALEQPAASKRPRGDDEDDVEKFTDFEIGHLVFARTGKANWAPAQISAVSTSTRGHQVYDVEFFVKENGVYPRAQNLPLSKLEAADEDTFKKHSGRRQASENWVEGMEKFRRVYDKSRRV